MPFISNKSFERIQRAGNQMGNLCFNLSQVSGQSHANIMKEAQIEWDAAIESLRREFIQRTSPRKEA